MTHHLHTTDELSTAVREILEEWGFYISVETIHTSDASGDHYDFSALPQGVVSYETFHKAMDEAVLKIGGSFT